MTCRMRGYARKLKPDARGRDVAPTSLTIPTIVRCKRDRASEVLVLRAHQSGAAQEKEETGDR